MSGVVLAVGALMLVAGGYEMFAGNGDILSERGWSAFIAGSVLLTGGVVTMAIGLAVRATDRLSGALLRGLPVSGAMFPPAERVEPPGSQNDAPPALAAAQPDLFHEPTSEQAPTAPVLAAAPIEYAPPRKSYSAMTVEPPPPHVEPEPEHKSQDPAVAEPQADDWLDHSFADLEREMTVRHGSPDAVASSHHESATTEAELVPIDEPVSTPSFEQEPHQDGVVHEEPLAKRLAPDPVTPASQAIEPTAALSDLATVSAREEPAPATSAVIGRYESEGTSYVMYADGSIDAQSEAGVYRFASMAELKAFIES